MKVTGQQPAPVPPPSAGGAQSVTAPGDQGKLKTDKSEYQASLGAPADVPAPAGGRPGAGARADNLNAALVTPHPLPSLTGTIAAELHSRHYASDWLLAGKPGARHSPVHLPGQGAQQAGLPQVEVNNHKRMDSYITAVDNQPQQAPEASGTPNRLDPAAAQRPPSGSLSRVSPRGSAPGSPAPKPPKKKEGDKEITTLLSQLSGNKTFFQRHGIEAPRENIRIPVLKLSLVRRDRDYKALVTRLDTALDTYRQTLTGAEAISVQTTKQRTQTLLELNAQLDQLEQSIVAEQRALPATDPKFGQKQALLNALTGVVDDERAMLVDVFNAFSQDGIDAGQPVSWQRALEFKRIGLNVGSNVNTGANQDKVVKSSKRFGSGACNTVSRLKFKDGSDGIFKPGVTHEIGERISIAKYWEIPKEQPRYEARNVASTNLDRLLDTGVLVKTEFFVHDNDLGVLMEKAPGQSAFDLCIQGDDRVVEKLVDNPRLHRELNKLQVMDALCGQHDRHFNNLFVATDAKGLNVQVKGIDNDACFGQREQLNDPAIFANPDFETSREREQKVNKNERDLAGMNASHNVGLPPLMDARLAGKLLAPGFAEQARATVEGLLNPTETERMNERIEAVQQHARYLMSYNLTVTDWDRGLADNGQPVLEILANDPKHSYSVIFGAMAARYKQQRLLNYALA